jgi:hypothetical protein
MTYIDRLYADAEHRALHPEGISIVVDGADLRSAAEAAEALGRRLGHVIHAEAIPGSDLVEVVFADLGPATRTTTTKGGIRTADRPS